MLPLAAVSQGFKTRISNPFIIHSTSPISLYYIKKPRPTKNNVSLIPPQKPTFAMNVGWVWWLSASFLLGNYELQVSNSFKNRVLKPLVWTPLLKACHNSRTMEFKSPCKETAIKVENHALLGMSWHLVINAQNGCVCLGPWSEWLKTGRLG